MFGTKTNVFMVRFTTILAVIFFSTSMILAFNSSKVDQSLMANKRLLATVPKTETPKAKSPDNDVQVKVESPKLMAPTQAAPVSKDVPVSPVTNDKK